MQTSIIHPYEISTKFMEVVWTMWKSWSMVFCRLAFISSHERKKKTILVLAVKAYVQCRGVAPVIFDLGTKCR